ncbi:6-phosphogluconate dehydrogenase [Obelidium mucronatum]|nr:6-phosphogluconate dehydrogenase [Obelidium mucronatum]
MQSVGQDTSKPLTKVPTKTPEASSVDDSNVLVLGGGNFGTCLADHLAVMGNSVTIYARDQKVVDGINKEHRNVKYMKDVLLPESLKATSKLDDGVAIRAADVILFSIPTQHLRDILAVSKPFIRKDHLTIFVNKGIEIHSGKLPCDIVEEVWGKEIGECATYLSGPSFAAEVVKRQPTCVSVASRVKSRALRAQAVFHAPYFRVYDCDDVVGVEVAGALKNVIALAAGACAGLGFQQNARAAIITRGLAEIMRIGVRLGADPLTFSGLAGVGDLFLTAQSEKSRNYTVGYRLGRGETLDHVLETLGSVAEGVETTKAAYELCRKLNVESPVCDAVYSVLFGGVEVKAAVKILMARDPHAEFHGLR